MKKTNTELIRKSFDNIIKLNNNENSKNKSL